MISSIIRQAFCCRHRQDPLPDRLQETVLSTVNIVNTEEGRAAGLALARYFRAEKLDLGEMVGRGTTSRVYELAGKTEKEVIKILRFSEKPTPGRGEAEDLVTSIRSPYLVTPKKILYYSGRMVAVAMPYCDGVDLDQAIREKEFSLRETARMGADLCEALGALHRKGVVHADVNLQNVRLTPSGRAVLFDMGLARKTGTLPSGDSSRGTLQYASFQRFVGNEPFDPLDDAYSLGVFLHRVFYRKFPGKAMPQTKNRGEAEFQKIVLGLMKTERESRMTVSEARARLRKLTEPRQFHPRVQRPRVQPD